MMTTGGGELFSEDGWPIRAEIKKRACVVSVQILIEFDLARKRTREHQRERRNKTRHTAPERRKKMLICFK